MTYPEERGFRVEPEFRQASGSLEGMPDNPGEAMYVPQTSTQLALPAGPPARAVTAAELDGAFDDPEHGEPGRDRFAVHVLWEVVLVLVGAGLAFAVLHKHSGALSGVHLRTLMVTATFFGLLALGAGISLRAGAVNLALGPIMLLSGLYFGQHLRDGFYRAAGFGLVLALACGLVIALVVVLFHLPGWAVSLAGYFGILLWLTHMPPTVVLTTRYDPARQGYYWFGAFALLAVIGSVLGAIRPIRRSVGRFRPIADPADRRGTSAAVITALALVGSSLLAGIAGIGMAMQQGAVQSGDGLLYTGIGVGIALLGGTSAYGRRGGILGTVLATAVYALGWDYVVLHNWSGGPLLLIVIALGAGVLVTRLIEAAGRPKAAPPTEDPNMVLGWLGQQQGSWAEPPRSAEDPTWADATDERWGAR